MHKMGKGRLEGICLAALCYSSPSTRERDKPGGLEPISFFCTLVMGVYLCWFAVAFRQAFALRLSFQYGLVLFTV